MSHSAVTRKLNEQHFALCLNVTEYTYQWSIHGGGPGPPLGKPKNVKGPSNGKFMVLPPPTESRGLLEATGKENFCYYPPTESRRLLDTMEKFCYYPPPLNRVGFWRPRKNSATTPPTESCRLGNHTKGAASLGKSWICDCIRTGVCVCYCADRHACKWSDVFLNHLTIIELTSHIDGLGHKPSNSEFKKKQKFHKITRDQVTHHV